MISRTDGRNRPPARRLPRRFPIWWYVAPRIINTFVESYDFTRKTLVPFATSGGSGMGRTVDELRKLCPNANWKAGKMVNGISDKALADWANTL